MNPTPQDLDASMRTAGMVRQPDGSYTKPRRLAVNFLDVQATDGCKLTTETAPACPTTRQPEPALMKALQDIERLPSPAKPAKGGANCAESAQDGGELAMHAEFARWLKVNDLPFGHADPTKRSRFTSGWPISSYCAANHTRLLK